MTEEFNTIINHFDQFRQNLQQRKENSSVFIQIDQWEKNSIEIIRQNSSTMSTNISQRKSRISHRYWREIQEENEVIEMNLKEKLIKISKEINDSSEIFIEEDSQTFIKRISVKSTRSKSKNNFFSSTKLLKKWT